MKKIFSLLVLSLIPMILGSQPSEKQLSYLNWIQQMLPEVPEWTEWQKATGELPPDFDQMPRCNLLPDPFRFHDGTRVQKNTAGWETRRTEIKQLFEKYVTGTFPPKPRLENVNVTEEIKGEGYLIRSLRAEFGPGRRGNVRIRLMIPDGPADKKFPVLISPNLTGWDQLLLRRGYISAGFAGNDFMDDAAPLKDLYPEYDFATLPRRAWLVSIVLDYLETVNQADMDRVAIFGYSRDGKMALIAAAFDERISALIAGSTGVGGVVPWRLSGERGGGESIETTTRMFPSWFVPRLRYFSGQEDRLPVDANLFLALVAPRAVLMEWGLNDQVANGWAMEQAYQSALKVYEMYGMPDRLSMLPVPGFHGSNDQDACIDWLDWQFGFSADNWNNDFVFPWDYDKWKKSSEEIMDINELPEKGPLIRKNISQKEWEEKAEEIRNSVKWMLGPAPPVMKQSDESMMRFPRRPAPGPTVIAQGKTGNPGQLSPDVHAWVIAAGGQEYGWLEPEKNITDSRSIRFGQGLTGDLYFPADTPADTKLPAVIWLHGYNHPLGYMWVYRRDLHPILALVKAGYAVFAYDQTGYGTRWKEAGPFYKRYPQWSRMGKMIEDLHDAVSTLSKESMVDKNDITVFGYTLGATLGLYAAALDERISCVVSVCGFTPMRTDTPESGLSGFTRYSHQHGLIPRLGLYEKDPSALPYDFDDIISLIAPRPVYIVQPLKDRDASPADVSSAVNNARIVYKLKGNPANLGLYEPDDFARLTTATQDKIIEWMKARTGTARN